MAVSAIQKNNQASYTKAALLGGVGGYALKYVLPVNQVEKDAQFSMFIDGVRKEATQAKIREIDMIRNTAPKTLAQDTFISMFDKQELTPSKINGLKEPLPGQIRAIITQINDKAREVKAFGQELFSAVAKQVRPASKYIAGGVAIGAATAFVYNVLGKMNK